MAFIRPCVINPPRCAREAVCNFARLEFHVLRHSQRIHVRVWYDRFRFKAVYRWIRKVEYALYLVANSSIASLRKLVNFLMANSSGILAK